MESISLPGKNSQMKRDVLTLFLWRVYTVIMLSNQAPKTVSRIPKGKTIAVICSSYHQDIVRIMEDDAKKMLHELGASNILTLSVPGAFELPLACLDLIRRKKVHGIVALGIIVQGETHHASEIARACTDGLMQVQLSTQIPIAHEVLYVNSVKVARERAGGEHGKGKEAAETLARMISIMNA